MSLLKAPMQTDKWCDFGDRRFVIRLNFHSTSFNSNVQMLSDSLVIPPIFVDGEEDKEKIFGSFVEIDNENIVLETLKPSEDGKGFIARLYEPVGGWVKGKIKFPMLKESYKAVHTDLKEEVDEEIEKCDFNTFSISLKPFQIFTMKLFIE